MEVFRIAAVSPGAAPLAEALSLDRLPEWCDEITAVRPDGPDSGEMDCLWGVFAVRREAITGGVRFSLPGCPNALQVTITTGFEPAPESVVVHCTINRTDPDPDFAESVADFTDAWARGLERGLA